MNILEKKIKGELNKIESDYTSPYQLLSSSFNSLSYALLNTNLTIAFDVNKDVVPCADYVVVESELNGLSFIQHSLDADKLYEMMGAYLNFDEFIDSQYFLQFLYILIGC